ncbi:hypothetical protein SK128_014411 [Halocaridina rubra]|uniref:Peptidase S1 domain-containing protein n=1 Tax=Halocaridina rubra TaxID=373956 RepID=A0AAN9ACV8_HALRR
MTAVNFSASIRPICMPEVTDVAAGDKAIVTGWGRTSFGGNISFVLQEVQVDMISLNECKTLYNNKYTITDNMVCAYTPNKDACQGDSGGPLIKELADGRWILIGIVSFGFECAALNSPGVYADVTKYISWITTVTGSSSC